MRDALYSFFGSPSKDNDSSKVIFDHEMTAQVFGCISLPSSSNYALKIWRRNVIYLETEFLCR